MKKKSFTDQDREKLNNNGDLKNDNCNSKT